jgi:hypothetical protein
MTKKTYQSDPHRYQTDPHRFLFSLQLVNRSRYRHEISARRSPPDRLQFHRVSLGYLQPFRQQSSCAFRLWVAALVNTTRTGLTERRVHKQTRTGFCFRYSSSTDRGIATKFLRDVALPIVYSSTEYLWDISSRFDSNRVAPFVCGWRLSSIRPAQV